MSELLLNCKYKFKYGVFFAGAISQLFQKRIYVNLLRNEQRGVHVEASVAALAAAAVQDVKGVALPAPGRDARRLLRAAGTR